MPVSTLVEKLWETIGTKGISALCKPGQIRREGIANIEIERKRMLIMAQTEKEAEEVKSGKAMVSLTDFSNPKVISLEGSKQYDTSDRMEPYFNMENLTKAMSTKLIANEIHKEVNIAKALFIAEDVLSSDKSKPVQENIEDDWLYRWRDSAATSSSEQLQDLWGRILAGELKSPGSYSLRTVDFIKNLTQKEASKIQKLFSFILFDNIIKSNIQDDKFPNDYLKENLNYRYLAEMQSLGILSGVDSLGLTLTLRSLRKEIFFNYYMYNEKVMQITHEDPNNTLKLGVISITPLGHELRSLCPVTIDSNYLNHVINIIKTLGFTVFIGDCMQDENGNRYYQNNVMV